MYCPSCGKEIPDKSAFCLHCGKPINFTTAPTNVVTEWEYKDYEGFENYLKSIGTAGANLSYSDIVQHTWSEIRPLVFNDIQAWLDDGWEPLTPIGSDSMKVETQSGGLFGGMNIYLTGVTIKMRRRQQVGAKKETIKSTFDVILLSCGRNKIEVIKVIRQFTKADLARAKTMAETSGTKIAKSVSKSIAENLASDLKNAGAQVQIE